MYILICNLYLCSIKVLSLSLSLSLSLIRRVYAECSPLLQLIKLINDLKNDESDTILQQMKMRNNSYRTFSIMFLNTYNPVCLIGIKTCYVCQLEAQLL